MRSISSNSVSGVQRSDLSPAGWGVIIVVAALLAVLAYASHGLTFAGLVVMLELWLLLAISVVDLREHRIPNRLLALTALLVVVGSLVFRQPAPVAALLGGCAGLAIFLLLARLRPGALGMGDVKLAGVIGLMVGFPQVAFALLVGIIAGGLVALVMWLGRRGGGDHAMAYAPYLALGAAIALLGA